MQSRSRKTEAQAKFISPKALAERWQCSRSSVDRIVIRAGLSRVFLGEGKNGMVRYLIEEIIAYEEERRFKSTDHNISMRFK